MSIKTIDAHTAHQWLNTGDALLIDVREPAEHRSANIPQAQLQPLGKICCSDVPQSSKKIIIHCQNGMRGNVACEKLLSEDATLEVYNLQGGIEAWQQAGLPVSQSSKRTLPLDRQVQLTIGLSVLTFSLLAYFVNPSWALGAAFFGAGLTNAGLTGWCGLAKLMAKMPWNR